MCACVSSWHAATAQDVPVDPGAADTGGDGLGGVRGWLVPLRTVWALSTQAIPRSPTARPADSPPGKAALGACPFPLQPGPSRPAALPAQSARLGLAQQAQCPPTRPSARPQGTLPSAQ